MLTPVDAPPQPASHAADGDRSARRPAGGSPRWLAPVLVAAVVAVAGAVVLWSYPGRFDSEPVFLSPHENARYELSRQWFDTGRPVYDDPLYDVLPADVAPALSPRDAAMDEGTVYPKDFPYAFSFVALLLGIWRPLAFLLNPISAGIVLVLAAALARELFASRAAMVLAPVLVATSAAFWSGSYGLIETGATPAAFVLAGTYLLVRNRRIAAPHPLVDGLAGACFGVAIGLHYAVAIVCGILAGAFVLLARGSRARSAAAIGAGTVAALVPAGVFNLWLYGSPIRTGYGIGADFFEENVEGSTAGLLGGQPQLLLEHVWRYLVRPEALIVVAAAVVGHHVSRRHPGSRPLALGLAAAALPYLFFVGARPLWGHESFWLNASFLRYLLPLFALAAVLAAGALVALVRRPGRSRLIGGVAVAVVVGLATLTVATAKLGPRHVRETVGHAQWASGMLLGTVPPDALLITRAGDKYVWPQRHTVVAAYLSRSAAERQEVGDHIYLLAPTSERLADVAARLVHAGHALYLWNDSHWFDSQGPEILAELDTELRSRGLQRLEVGPDVWHFVPVTDG